MRTGRPDGEAIVGYTGGHDQFISYGSLPVSVIEWLMFDDDSQVRAALH